MLMEWLRPLSFVAPIENAAIFLWLLVYFSLIAIANLFSFMKLLLQAGGVIGAIYYQFYQPLLDGPSWRDYLVSEWSYNYKLLLTMDYWSTTAFARTVGFILALWIVTEVVYRAVLQKNQGVWFTLTTAAYLILLDIVTVYDVKWALVRMAVYSMLLLALLQMRQVERQWIQMPGQWNPRLSWLLVSLAVILAITSVAYAIPKPQEAAVESYQFVPQSRYSQQKVGYQSGDSTLGGPFIGDESIVFSARTPEKHYWRGESRSIYTGSEWKDGGETISKIQSGTDFHFQPLIQNMKMTEGEFRTKVEFPVPQYHVLFYGGQLKKVIATKPEKAVLKITGNHDIEALFPSQDNQYISSYEVLIDIPVINEELLKKSTNQYPRDIQGNLQLPLNLPARVQNLAHELTKEKKDPYSKVLAIQDYLKYKGGFVYEKEDVPYLEKGQDFVDQFLFESKKGYCDHFSSSMVVLLRSIGIPARYVKGFSTGDMIKQGDNLYEVTVKNKNAHSWPEVYFAGYGWVPFEPTPGFVQPVKHGINQTHQKEDAQPVNQVIPPAKNDRDKMKDLKKDLPAGKASATSLSIWVFIILAIFLAAAFLIWTKKKYNMQFWLLLQRSKRVEKADGLAQIYVSFLALLGRMYSTRKNSESLQEFVSRITLHEDKKLALKDVTHWYEKYLYGKSSDNPKDWSNNRNILQKLIKYFLS